MKNFQTQSYGITLQKIPECHATLIQQQKKYARKKLRIG
jgi:hypothetical protein